MLWNAGCRHSGISSYGSWDCLLWGMWYIPRPGNEPVSLALADGLFTIRPAGKSYQYVFNFVILEPVKFTGKLQAYYKESLQTPIPVPRLLTSAFADIHPFPPHSPKAHSLDGNTSPKGKVGILLRFYFRNSAVLSQYLRAIVLKFP